ncbi:MAG: pantoate--beta-alanine ligase [Sphingobacteriales bacterium]|nr:pantoate--beta-alanine ligase [Sphingobacteriales bacterium]MBI3717376.1 pantoate--beta-alanine ligase [Sphingobacteriales bacterium]
MIIFKKKRDLQTWLTQQKSQGKSIGFAPTMGALHEGHLSLLQTSKKENDITLTSIFVNPTQFNDPKDFAKYPITLENDIYMLEQTGCDVLFLPAVDEIYPPNEPKGEQYNLGYLETVLEGKFRPGHFQGVCQVMYRLLSIFQPHNLYMGQKDYQQCMVIKRLIQLADFSCKLHICPTLREKEGLAMSSRNLRLTAEERKKVLAIYITLLYLKKEYSQQAFSLLKENAVNYLLEAGFVKIDYIELANADDLTLLDKWDDKTPVVALIAAFMGEIRLIDNMVLTGSISF